MEEKYKYALAEVDEILKNTDEELLKKIPVSFKEFIKENKSEENISKIVSTKSLNEQEILPETQAILALIYRSYWATEEEKKEFAEQDAIELEKEEQTKKELYNVDVFKSKVEKSEKIENEENPEKENIKNNVTDIMVIEETKWYKKVWNKICSLLRIKHTKTQ